MTAHSRHLISSRLYQKFNAARSSQHGTIHGRVSWRSSRGAYLLFMLCSAALPYSISPGTQVWPPHIIPARQRTDDDEQGELVGGLRQLSYALNTPTSTLRPMPGRLFVNNLAQGHADNKLISIGLSIRKRLDMLDRLGRLQRPFYESEEEDLRSLQEAREAVRSVRLETVLSPVELQTLEAESHEDERIALCKVQAGYFKCARGVFSTAAA